MFLDDRLYQIAKSVDYTHWKHKTTIRVDIFQAVIEHILEQHSKLVKEASSCDEDLFVTIKRAKRHWYNTLTKLEKEGIVLFNEKEFRSFEFLISHHPLFKGFSDALLAYIR